MACQLPGMSAAFFRILDTVAKPHWGEILRCLSLHAPIPVKVLAKKLGMSYMGVKQHCQEMHSVGLLHLEQRKGGVGRPQHLYYLTPDAWALFPSSPVGLETHFLQQISSSEGVTAAHRVVYSWFQELAAEWVGTLPASGMERWKEARTRLLEAGCVVEWVKSPQSRFPALLVSHRPWGALVDATPPFIRFETQFFSAVCDLNFQRESVAREKMPPATLFHQP